MQEAWHVFFTISETDSRFCSSGAPQGLLRGLDSWDQVEAPAPIGDLGGVGPAARALARSGPSFRDASSRHSSIFKVFASSFVFTVVNILSSPYIDRLVHPYVAYGHIGEDLRAQHHTS